jgi:signal recognition particle subunit SRP19
MPDHFYVYPSYLDRGLSRAEGRRIPEPEAVGDLTVEEIARAAQRLGFRAEVESAKQYPRRAWSGGGRVKIAKRSGTTKAGFLRPLAREIRKLRGEPAKARS